jgi:hypothetical protein
MYHDPAALSAAAGLLTPQVPCSILSCLHPVRDIALPLLLDLPADFNQSQDLGHNTVNTIAAVIL